MVTSATQFELERSLDEVFDFLADCRSELVWNSAAAKAEPLDEGPLREGSRFLLAFHGAGRLSAQVTSLEYPRQISFAAAGRRLHSEVVYTLTPLLAGTEVERRVSWELRGVFSPVEPLLAALMRRRLRRSGAKIAHAFERGWAGAFVDCHRRLGLTPTR